MLIINIINLSLRHLKFVMVSRFSFNTDCVELVLRFQCHSIVLLITVNQRALMFRHIIPDCCTSEFGNAVLPCYLTRDPLGWAGSICVRPHSLSS